MHIPFDHRPICSKVDFQPDRCVDCVSLYSSNKITQGLGNNLVTDSIPADDLISEKRWVGAHVLVRDTPGEYELPKIVCLLGVQIRAHLLGNGNTLETSMLGSSPLEVQKWIVWTLPAPFCKTPRKYPFGKAKKKALHVGSFSILAFYRKQRFQTQDAGGSHTFTNRRDGIPHSSWLCHQKPCTMHSSQW